MIPKEYEQNIIKLIQKFLNNMHFGDVQITGNWDSATEDAWQKYDGSLWMKCVICGQDISIGEAFALGHTNCPGPRAEEK